MEKRLRNFCPKPNELVVSVLLFFWIPVFAQGQGKIIYWSPDETLQAIVTPIHIAEPDFHEHLVEIKTKDGKMLYKLNHSSADHEHGRCILHAAWSPDSKFFAYSTTSSGGHSCWHCHTYCYVREKNSIYYLDELVGGALVEADFLFTKPAVFHSKIYNYDEGQDKVKEPIPVKKDLNQIEFKKEYIEPDSAANAPPSKCGRS